MGEGGRVNRLIAALGGIHPSVRDDPLAASRHASFIATHLAGGALAAVVLAGYLAMLPTPDPTVVVALAWLVLPAAMALMLMRRGKIEHAYILSAGHHAALVVGVAAVTGGFSSFIVPWIIVVPVESALSGRRRVVVAAFGLAALALLALFGFGAGDLLPPVRPLGAEEGTLNLIGVASAGIYACLLALAVQTLSQASELAARASARAYRLMAENATDLISVHRTNGEASFVSPGAQRLIGADPALLAGRGFLAAVNVADRPAFLRTIAAAAGGAGEAALTYRLCAPGGGATVWVETRCRPLGAGDGGEVIAVTRDVSEAQAREEDLRQARDAAEGASRAKTRFLANVSHELRTPLNAIIGFSDILVSGTGPAGSGPDRSDEFAALIGESGRHLLNIVNDLLDMSRIEADRYEIAPQMVSLDEILRSCCDLMGPVAAEAGVTVSSDPVGSVPQFLADKRALKQIVLNLLSNAVKFSEPGGTVNLTARTQENSVAIEVSDRGIGMSAGDLTRIGEPFVQADGDYDRNYQGTGLGLALVKGLVRLHGGEIVIASELGAGTTVTVTLPRGEAFAAGKSEEISACRLAAGASR